MRKITFNMSLIKTSLLGLSLLMVTSVAHARDYASDFNNLVDALKQSHFKTENLWNFQDPLLGAQQFILPESRAPWAGNYFPMAEGGIANRWQKKTYPAADEVFADLQTAKRMTSKEINQLSAAEKYDLYVGDYDYSVTKHELFVRGPYRASPPQDWEGFCNGVRCAGFSTPEPVRFVDVVNPDGIKIRFQPADLKALAGASFFYAENYSDIGGPTRGQGKAGNQPNAAVFDLALRYYLAEKQKSFVIDTHLGSEIWNESIVGYSRKMTSKSELSNSEKYTYPTAVSKIFVKVRLYSLGEISMDQTNKKTKNNVSAGNVHTETPVAYTLYLDKDGKAIDGEWRNGATERGVDFAWFASGRGMDSQYPPEKNVDSGDNFTGNKFLKFDILKDLLKKAKEPRLCRSMF